MIRRKRPRSKSPKRRRLEDIYSEWRAKFLEENPRCARFPQHKATDIHHTRGRAGPLIIDVRFWKAVSRGGHRWIEENGEAARALGLLCQRGQWNTPPNDDETRRLRIIIATV